MGWNFVQDKSFERATAGTEDFDINIQLDSVPSEGNLLVAFLYMQDPNTPTYNITGTSDFIQSASGQYSGDDKWVAQYYKIARNDELGIFSADIGTGSATADPRYTIYLAEFSHSSGIIKNNDGLDVSSKKHDTVSPYDISFSPTTTGNLSFITFTDRDVSITNPQETGSGTWIKGPDISATIANGTGGSQLGKTIVVTGSTDSIASHTVQATSTKSLAIISSSFSPEPDHPYFVTSSSAAGNFTGVNNTINWGSKPFRNSFLLLTANPTGQSITSVPGWTKLHQVANGDELSTWYRVANANESSSVEVRLDASDTTQWILTEWRNVYTAIHASSSAETSGTLNVKLDGTAITFDRDESSSAIFINQTLADVTDATDAYTLSADDVEISNAFEIIHKEVAGNHGDLALKFAMLTSTASYQATYTGDNNRKMMSDLILLGHGRKSFVVDPINPGITKYDPPAEHRVDWGDPINQGLKTVATPYRPAYNTSWSIYKADHDGIKDLANNKRFWTIGSSTSIWQRQPDTNVGDDARRINVWQGGQYSGTVRCNMDQQLRLADSANGGAYEDGDIEGYTISYWMRATSNSYTRSNILGSATGTTDGDFTAGSAFVVNWDSAASSWALQTDNTGHGYEAKTRATWADLDTWHHYCFVELGNDRDGNSMYAYRDGEHLETWTPSDGTFFIHRITFSQIFWHHSAASSQHGSAWMNLLRMWNRSLSPGEVWDLYANPYKGLYDRSVNSMILGVPSPSPPSPEGGKFTPARIGDVPHTGGLILWLPRFS